MSRHLASEWLHLWSRRDADRSVALILIIMLPFQHVAEPAKHLQQRPKFRVAVSRQVSCSDSEQLYEFGGRVRSRSIIR